MKNKNLFALCFILSLVPQSLFAQNILMKCRPNLNPQPIEAFSIDILENNGQLFAHSTYSLYYLVEKPMIFEVESRAKSNKTLIAGEGFQLIIENKKAPHMSYHKATVEALCQDGKVRKSEVLCEK